MPAGSFSADITAIRERARQKVGEGRFPEDILADEGEHVGDIVNLLGA